MLHSQFSFSRFVTASHLAAISFCKLRISCFFEAYIQSMSAIVSENPTINEQKNKATFPGDQKASGATLEGTGGFALQSHGRTDQF